MKKLLAVLAFAFVTSAHADTPCWVYVDGNTVNANQISSMYITEVGDRVYVVLKTGGNNIAYIQVPSVAAGKKMIAEIVGVTKGCK